MQRDGGIRISVQAMVLILQGLGATVTWDPEKLAAAQAERTGQTNGERPVIAWGSAD